VIKEVVQKKRPSGLRSSEGQ